MSTVKNCATGTSLIKKIKKTLKIELFSPMSSKKTQWLYLALFRKYVMSRMFNPPEVQQRCVYNLSAAAAADKHHLFIHIF